MARSTARAAVMQMIFENLAGGEGGEEAATTTEAKKLTDGGANTEGGFGELHPVS